MDQNSTEISNTYAAIDLGSNSFHLAIGVLSHGELRWQQRMSEKVQLASGIDEFLNLSEETEQRAIECLHRFKKRVSQIEPTHLRIVGTNALRMIRNSSKLLSQIESLFKQRVDVISGREEARLIYLGVAHTSPTNKKCKLVIDIGGGSTEFIIGKHFSPILTESLHMGCVSFKQTYFSNGKLTKANFKKAIAASQQQVQLISSRYQKQGWELAFGASGSVKSIFGALKSMGAPTEKVTLEDLKSIVNHLVGLDHIDNIDFSHIKPERYPIFPSGLAILIGIMQQLEIQELAFSEGALREGLIYDLLGRLEPENVRERTVEAAFQRYGVDKDHAAKVEKTASKLYKSLQDVLPDIGEPYYEAFLKISAQLHEIGLSISHTQFHKHGAYILSFSDLAGFSRQEQLFLGTLVRLHRRKFSLSALEALPDSMQQQAKLLAVILRLAVLLHHGRHQTSSLVMKKVQVMTEKSNEKTLCFSIDHDWLEKNPLVHMDLDAEQELLKKAGVTLQWEVI